jgi:hypothetical protein
MKLVVGLLASAAFAAAPAFGQNLKLNDKGYFAEPGLNVMVFNDYYPEGHQTGVTIVQHGTRVAANGDLRLSPSPGQWSPVPKTVTRTVDPKTNTISQTLVYPNPDSNGHGYNPVFYPDLNLSYRVSVTPLAGNSFRIRLDLDKPLPSKWVGRVGFNLELFPGLLFGKSWLMDGQGGIFRPQPQGPMVLSGTGEPVDVPLNVQANGPAPSPNDEPLSAPLASGHVLVVAPESDQQRLRIESRTGELQLLDGRSNHNNGWFIVRGLIPAGASSDALEWVVTPNVIPGWKSPPVIQVSQLGYAPAQPKEAIIETDPADRLIKPVEIDRLTPTGEEKVSAGTPQRWGDFLRYGYYRFDFSKVTKPGMYVVRYGSETSQPFRIAPDVYASAWEPTLDYFLPVQMCHMRVNEKYRVWHGLDHMDDAVMAPAPINHFDGWKQGPSTLTKFKPGEHIPGMNQGGWHDAGDYDVVLKSQIGTIWLLSKMVEEFGLNYDATTIDEQHHVVEIHDPDGKNDAVQQIEHGLLSVMGGYRAMGVFASDIIDPTLRQYAMLGEAANQSDGIVGAPVAGLGLDNNGHPIPTDDRWVFTTDDPDTELTVAAGLATASRVIRSSDPAFAAETLAAARTVFDRSFAKATSTSAKVFALSELIGTTGDPKLVAQLVSMEPQILGDIENSAWHIAPILDRIPDAGFKQRLGAAVAAYQAKLNQSAKTDSPYGVPYKPDIWGAGWTIQERGVRQYFFHKAWPQATSTDSYINALNFDLGVHPGENTESFVSGVGSKSATIAYGFNRADWSYIPGGVVSGTALIRPDLPEFKEWPFFWQQREYVMGGGATNFMFLALAADRLYRNAAAQESK